LDLNCGLMFDLTSLAGGGFMSIFSVILTFHTL